MTPITLDRMEEKLAALSEPERSAFRNGVRWREGAAEQAATTAQTTAQRQADHRARMALAGYREVRGIYLPPALHIPLRELAKRLLRRFERS